MPTLACRIQTLDPFFTKQAYEDERILKACQERFKAVRPLLKRCVHINLDNVAEYYALSKKQFWSVEDDIPNWSPPWSLFFAEWEQAKKWLKPEGFVNLEEKDRPQSGFLCMACDFRNLREDQDKESTTREVIQAFAGVGNLGPLMESFREKLPAARWMLCLDTYWQFRGPPFNGHPTWPTLQRFVLVDEKGVCLANIYVSALMTFDQIDGPVRDTLDSMLHIFGLGLSFCHCKNVAMTKRVIEAKPKQVRQGHPPRQEYYVLNIEPMKKVLRTEGNSETEGLQLALHICRGHFATYKEEAPLFGKTVGTFYVPMHLRGSKEAGTVTKDYSAGKVL